jgi:hypothetical protein
MDGYGSVIIYVHHLQVVTTRNYNIITDIHTTNILRLFSLGVSW